MKYLNILWIGLLAVWLGRRGHASVVASHGAHKITKQIENLLFMAHSL